MKITTKISLFIAILICFSAPPLTGAAELRPEEVARRLQDAYEKTTSMSANFRQVTSVRSSPREKHGSGTLVIQKPGRMRWDYQEPAQQVLVADGETVSMYYAQAEQMMVIPAREYLQSDVTYAFFTGQGDILRDFEPLPAEKILTQGAAAHVIKLVPRKDHPQVQELRLWVSPESFLIERLRVLDHFGTVTDLFFSQIKIDVDLPAALFTFTPPAGTEIIRQ
jgi:outer membrane lipoprotein carrier protein